MKNDDKLLQCALRIEQLVRRLTDRPERCRHCLLEVSWMPDPPSPSVASAVTKAFNHAEAAHFLGKSKRQVYRYRLDGRLPFMRDNSGQYYYEKADLEQLFETLWGYPKGGFGK